MITIETRITTSGLSSDQRISARTMGTLGRPAKRQAVGRLLLVELPFRAGCSTSRPAGGTLLAGVVGEKVFQRRRQLDHAPREHDFALAQRLERAATLRALRLRQLAVLGRQL